MIRIRTLQLVGFLFAGACCGCQGMPTRESKQSRKLQPIIGALNNGLFSIDRSKLVSTCGLAGLKSTVHPPGFVEPSSGHQYTGVSEIWVLEDGYKLVGVHHFPKPRPEEYKAIDDWFAKMPMPPPPHFSYVSLLDSHGLVIETKSYRHAQPQS